MLRWHPLHIRRSICPIPLRSPHVALPPALDLVQDDARDDDQEHAAEGQAERDQNNNAVRVVIS